MQKAKEYFKNNPEEKEVFSTSDGFLFKLQMYATAHAATITDKEVVKHVNDAGNVVAMTPAVEVPVSTVTEEGGEVHTKNETVDAAKITDAPSEVDGIAKVITETIKENLDAAVVSEGAVGTTEANADQKEADKAAAAKTVPAKPKTGAKKPTADKPGNTQK